MSEAKVVHGRRERPMDGRHGQVPRSGRKPLRGAFIRFTGANAAYWGCRWSARTGFAFGTKPSREALVRLFAGSGGASVMAVVFTCNTYSPAYKGKGPKKTPFSKISEYTDTFICYILYFPYFPVPQPVEKCIQSQLIQTEHTARIGEYKTLFGHNPVTIGPACIQSGSPRLGPLRTEERPARRPSFPATHSDRTCRVTNTYTWGRCDTTGRITAPCP